MLRAAGIPIVHDLLRNNGTDDDLLTIRPALSSQAPSGADLQAWEGGWQAESLILRLTSGFRFYIDVQPLVAEFLSLCDCSRTASKAIAESTNGTVAVEKVHPRKFVTIRSRQNALTDFFGSLGYFLSRILGATATGQPRKRCGVREKKNADQQRIMSEWLNMIRKLVEREFIVAAGDGDLATETAGPTVMHEIN